MAAAGWVTVDNLVTNIEIAWKTLVKTSKGQIELRPCLLVIVAVVLAVDLLPLLVCELLLVLVLLDDDLLDDLLGISGAPQPLDLDEGREGKMEKKMRG